jgi:hypothetical protein
VQNPSQQTPDLHNNQRKDEKERKKTPQTMVHKSTVNRSSPPGGLVGVIIRTTFRLLQIIIALIIAGLYGRDLQTDSEHGDHADSRWVYAEVVAGFSLLTAAVYLLPFIQSFKFFFWDAILL